MKNSRICIKCGNADNKMEDPVRGITICAIHKTIIDDSFITNQVEFVAGGGQGMIGTLVAQNNQGGSNARIIPGMGGLFQSSDSKQQRLANINRIINQIGLKLGINKSIRDLGFRYHKIASTNYSGKSLTQGRDTRIVAAACLYMACRIEQSPYLLIDFADTIKVDMFKIAEVFNIFRSQILLKEHNIPIIDPSLYIEKFCKKLEFEDKFHQVKNTAIRLIQSMNRSWITTGRRPNGLCGAAILIAAKIHGFRRTPAQITKAVHVCEETIRKRLDEFKETKTAKLTRIELKEIEMKQQDPHQFTYEPKNYYEPPEISKQPILESLKMDESQADNISKMLREELNNQATKFNQRLQNLEREKQFMIYGRQNQSAQFTSQNQNQSFQNGNNNQQQLIQMRDNAKNQYYLHNISQEELFERDRIMMMIGENQPIQDNSLLLQQSDDKNQNSLVLYKGKQSQVEQFKVEQNQVVDIVDIYEKERTDMTIDTAKFNTKEGEIIPIDDVDDKLVQQYYLSKEKKLLKEMIWKTQNADYLKQQEQREKNKLRLQQMKNQKGRLMNKGIMSQISQVSQSGGRMTPADIIGQEDDPIDSSIGKNNSDVNIPLSASISELSAHSDKHTNSKEKKLSLIGEKRNYQQIQRNAGKISFKISKNQEFNHKNSSVQKEQKSLLFDEINQQIKKMKQIDQFDEKKIDQYKNNQSERKRRKEETLDTEKNQDQQNQINIKQDQLLEINKDQNKIQNQQVNSSMLSFLFQKN